MIRITDRPEVAALERADLYLATYLKTCTRLDFEKQCGRGLNVERLQRRLQRLYDKIVIELENDKAREDLENMVSCAIGRAITDHGLPRTLRPPLPHPQVFEERMKRERRELPKRTRRG